MTIVTGLASMPGMKIVGTVFGIEHVVQPDSRRIEGAAAG